MFDAVSLLQSADGINTTAQRVPSSATDCRAVMAKIGNPVGVLANGKLQLLPDMLEQRGKEVDVLWEDARILHPQDPRALQQAILQVQVELSAALGLALIRPVDGLAALEEKGMGITARLDLGSVSEALNHVRNLLLHPVPVVALLPSPLRHVPAVVLLLRVRPPHVLLRVELQCAPREKRSLDNGLSDGYVLDDTDKVADGVVAALGGGFADVAVELPRSSEPRERGVEVDATSPEDPRGAEHGSRTKPV
eukprot:CAMPEP_0171176968 /NCGR_PEP_ID=MMETSP0790-20130122/12003_1 /TAXON_ID=2925 /ORGANISM="Alexandrium catenella, Strain OF101" /LENGTH=250 /DNA_ID=CAMNT_0011641863 /DNA_START=47 /DNA_END=799 /DNA_ORIENTATION=+